jgi:molybdopterin molybdotransferase
MIPVDEALRIIADNTPLVACESVEIEDSVGRILADDVVSDMDLPPFDRSQMDGFAVIASDTERAPVVLRVVGESAAGAGWIGTLRSGETARIMTGARVPSGADAVQKVELTSSGATGHWGDNGQVQILEGVTRGKFIVERGSEVTRGERVLATGEVVGANNIATLAAFGYSRVKVARRPRVAIMSTGTEIVDVDQRPADDQIRNSNSIVLRSLAHRCGASVEVFPVVGDDLGELKRRIGKAASGTDLLVITGGVSVGKYDLTKLALAELGANMFFEHVKLKPGKPTVFATLGNTVVFGLPGNPVSAAVTFYIFVREALLRMQGARHPALRSSAAITAASIKAARERDTYLPARTSVGMDGIATVTSLAWKGSSDLVSFSKANSLISLEAGEERSAGELTRVLYLDV